MTQATKTRLVSIFLAFVLGIRAVITTAAQMPLVARAESITYSEVLDDLKKDLRRKNYNPFAAAYKVKTEKQLAEHFDDVKFIMYSVLNRIAQCFNDLNLSLYECFPRNVLLLSIREKTQTILNKYKSPTEAK